jgi:hypothetical protein
MKLNPLPTVYVCFIDPNDLSARRGQIFVCVLVICKQRNTDPWCPVTVQWLRHRTCVCEYTGSSLTKLELSFIFPTPCSQEGIKYFNHPMWFLKKTDPTLLRVNKTTQSIFYTFTYKICFTIHFHAHTRTHAQCLKLICHKHACSVFTILLHNILKIFLIM